MQRFRALLITMCFLGCFVAVSKGEDAPVEKRTIEQTQRIEQPEKRHGALDDILNKVTIGGVLAGAYQYQLVNDGSDVRDLGRGAAVFQPEISISPTDADEIFFKFGFGAGNGLNKVTAFNLISWAADLENDVKDINGRGRDYLLTAWYKHTVKIGDEHTLGLTGGIIDATDYLDENAFANNEFTQFMNEALVNGPNGFSPSYDLGGALEWECGSISLKGVFMSVGENDDSNSYTFWGTQLGYRLDSDRGEGNYRLIYQHTSDDFLNSAGTEEESCQAFYVSCDQEFGPILGGWIRFGVHDDDHATNYQNLLSGGINAGGALWGREQDNIGIGYGYLNQGSGDIDNTHIAEAYLRIILSEIVAVSFDVQYENDDYKTGTNDDVHGWVTGMRITAEF